MIQHSPMKKILLSVFAIFAISALLAQSLEIIDESGNIITGTTIIVSGDPSALDISKKAYVVNKSGVDLDVKVKRKVNNIVTGSENYFCWTACYSPSVTISPNAEYIMALDTNKKFSGYIKPNGYSGTSNISYIFYDVNNPLDSSFINISFIVSASTGIDESTTGYEVISPAFPSPASNMVSIKFEINDLKHDPKIAVYNMAGAVVKEFELNENINETVTFSVSDLPSGVYFYSLILNGERTKTRKLIIAH